MIVIKEEEGVADFVVTPKQLADWLEITKQLYGLLEHYDCDSAGFTVERGGLVGILDSAGDVYRMFDSVDNLVQWINYCQK